MNLIQSAMMGFVSGLTELLPLSAEAHRGLLRFILDVESEGALFLLSTHIAVLVMLLAVGGLDLIRLYRTSKLLHTPTRRRTGRPNLNSAGTLRLLRSAALMTVVGRALSLTMTVITRKLYLLALPLLVMGLILWVPTLFRTANKDGRHLAAADGTLLGLGALAAAVPGISLVGCVVSIGSVRGVERRYAVRFAWLLAVVGLLSAIGFDCMALYRDGFDFSASVLLSAGVGAATAAAGTVLSIQIVRSLIRPGGSGLSGFCYYNWGMALLCLALFLMV